MPRVEQILSAHRQARHTRLVPAYATAVAAAWQNRKGPAPPVRAMEAAARRADKTLVVGPSHGFDAPVQRAAELVAPGEYGAVRIVTAFNFTDFMYRPRRPEALDSSRGGGVVYSQAAHQIDVVRRIVGQPVASVRAVAGNWDTSRPSEGAYTALMTFAGGAAATLTYGGYAHYDSDELVGWFPNGAATRIHRAMATPAARSRT